jgi:uncharacterized protein (UPF0335 family)
MEENENIVEVNDTSVINSGQLKSYIERLERLDEEKKTTMEDIKEVFAEIKGNGFDTKIIKMILKLRKQDRDEREEEEALLDLYISAIGL